MSDNGSSPRERVEEVLEERSLDFPQLVSLIEDGDEETREILEYVARPVPEATVVGVTGPPGAGKSTLVNELIQQFRDRGETVGVVAIDPESDETGGAFLGDRIRLHSSVSRDEEVFYRSISTPGEFGRTLSNSTVDIINLLDAWGRDVIIIETVGAGQTDTEIAQISNTVLLTLSPGAGDQIQIHKSGILEIGDIFVVNKADISGAESLTYNLSNLVARRRELLRGEDEVWEPPILKTIATEGKNVDVLVNAIYEHESHLDGQDNPKEALIKRMLENKIDQQIRAEFSERLEYGNLQELIDRIHDGEANVYGAIESFRKD